MGRREAAAMQRALVSISLGEKLAAAGRRQEAADELAKAHASAAVVHRKWLALHARFSDRANLRLWRRLGGADHRGVAAHRRERQSSSTSCAAGCSCTGAAG